MPATPPTPYHTNGNANAEDAASATDAEKKDESSPKTNGETFRLRYDTLVIAVGAYNQSEFVSVKSCRGETDNILDLPAFNVPGVKEHAHFLKDIRDARAIRSRILECAYHSDPCAPSCTPANMSCVGFEQANQPTITDADRRSLLNFCIVGTRDP